MNFFRRTTLITSLSILFVCGCDLSVKAQTPSPTATPVVSGTPAVPPTNGPETKVANAPDTLSAPANIKRIGIDSSQTMPLSLDEAIRKALENNNNVEVARNDVRYAETQLRALQGIYDPTFGVTPLFTRSSQNGSTPTNNFSVDFSGTQLLKSGGSIQPFFNNSRSGFVSSTSANGTTVQTVSSSAAFFRTATGVSFSQPLFRNFRIDNTRRNIKIQRRRLQQTDADFRRTTIDTIAQVQRAYWDLVFALRDQQNRVANLNLSKENLRRVEAAIAGGKSAPLERAEVATELANRESDLLLAAQQVSIADNTLKQLLLRESTAPEWIKQIVPTDQPSLDLTPVNLEDALADARANRPELQRLKLQTEINSIDIDYYKNQTKPQVDLNSSFSLNGFSQSFGAASTTTATTPLITSAADLYLLNAINSIRASGTSAIVNPTITTTSTAASGGFFNALGNLFNTTSPAFQVGVTIGFPIRNKIARANLAGARIQQQQIDAQTRSQEETVIAEVRNAVQAVETTRQRVFASRRARENAEIQLQGEQNLYDVGRSTTFLLFQRENALVNARNAEIRSETDYNKAIADLQRATSTTFRANNIEVQSPINNK